MPDQEPIPRGRGKGAVARIQRENIPRALPLAAFVYGHDVRIVSDPARLDAELVVRSRASQAGAGFDAPRPGEHAGCSVLRYGELTIDTASRVVTYGPMPVELRRREYALLAYMARDPERVWTRHELLRDVWGYRSDGTTRTVDSHASRLRAKLAAAGGVGWVVSEWGVGYRLAPGRWER
jgi:DNA-binding response OmpR family regulator